MFLSLIDARSCRRGCDPSWSRLRLELGQEADDATSHDTASLDPSLALPYLDTTPSYQIKIIYIF